LTATKPHTLTDEAIVHLVVNEGKGDLFGLLYDRYANKVYGKCLSFVKDKEVAQDMVQEILVKAFTRLSAFRIESRFSTWLYAITYNYCVEQYRRNQRNPISPLDDTLQIAEDDDSAERELLSLKIEQLKIALDRVSPEDKMILLMKYQDDMSIREMMETLELQESAVKMRLARARSRVRQAANLDTREEL
jgi:RNA polymerase sigma-70 factor (ECF subfamily)